MLGKNDRITFTGGSCGFEDANKRPCSVNEKKSRNVPMARIDEPIIAQLGLYLASAMDCRLVFSEEGPDASKKIVLTILSDLGPKHRNDPMPFKADSKLSVAAGTNEEGCKTITWLLEALFAKKFTQTSTPDFLIWSPPGKATDTGPAFSAPKKDPPTPAKSGPATQKSGAKK